ncbi:MAG: DUF4230 domain-containing protein [Chloroflexi bacterium CFX1]|nr:DUF4230 domain-containing protein [Chloroflexi bacterium CFX1]MCK6567266.1 DUF4230 domain-containing protein [Anaerolineales bacterium]MCQ3952089.1 hypothetical protein [Chloroflexota bacterium]MDL1919458.1 DUF4230 domain-containing protein [Chloroflexi bacterium CFX5]NUQ57856.1 DUF4230 domain-containing protein [Anaerolineales bacterium]
MKNTFNTVMSILILIVLAAGVYFIVETVRDTAAAASQPFEQVNEANYALQTQMAQLMNPTPTIIPDPVTYINEIRALARLETIQYSVSQVMTGEDRQGTLGFAFGTKILVVVHGSVIAGIDMEKIQPGDMRLENGVLYVNLPPAEVLAVTLDTEKVEVYTLQEGVLADVDPTLVLQTVQGGQDKILSVALDDGILQQAERNAEAYLLRFFSALGYDTVVFPQN